MIHRLHHIENISTMSKNNQKITKLYQRFVQEACQLNQVWALKQPEGYAITYSLQYSNANGEATPMFCFWSEKSLAAACAQKEWDTYKPESISLSEFMEGWCIGLSNDELLIGSNFDHNMIGYEVDPLMLILDLIAELKHTKKKIEFMHFENLKDLEEQIKEVLS